jgi:hypothetical protein
MPKIFEAMMAIVMPEHRVLIYDLFKSTLNFLRAKFKIEEQQQTIEEPKC